MVAFTFAPPPAAPEAERLRAEIREFLAGELRGRSARARAGSWGSRDPEFSRKMGARGWIGMTWPKRYGGHERTALERYVVLEEVLAAGALGSSRTPSSLAPGARPASALMTSS